MEIIQWLYKLAKAPGRSESSNSINCDDYEPTTTLTNRRTGSSSTRGSKKRKQRNYRGVWLWCRKDVAEACFYRTLNLKRVSSFRREHLIRVMAKMKAAGDKEEVITSTRFDPKKAIKVVGAEKNDETGKEKAKTEQGKAKATLSRMKELIRWAAAAKSDKAVKFFAPKMMDLRNRRKMKMMREESKRMSNESANISLSCESCTTTLSSSDHISLVSSPAIFVSLGPTPLYRCRSRKGNWITTDSEFVVLEL